jgi:hypothetical protein
MKVFVSDLAQYDISRLIICSIDQALYQAVAVIEGEEHIVWESSDRCLRSHSLMALREQFQHLDSIDLYLRHESAYDEMIGMAEAEGGNRLQVRLSRDPYSAGS